MAALIALIVCGMIVLVVWLLTNDDKERKSKEKLNIVRDGLWKMAWDCDGGCDSYEHCYPCQIRRILKELEEDLGK